MKKIVLLRPMRRIVFILVLVSTALSWMACSDQFEKVRREPNVQTRLQAALAYYEEAEYQKAQYLLEDILPILKTDTIGERLYFIYAYTHYHQKNYNFASYYFKQFSATYPNSKRTEEAIFMTAYSHYRLSAVYRLDQGDTEKAIDGFQTFANSYPNSPKVAECNNLIDQMRRKLEQKAYESANLYYRLGDYKSAVYSFQNLLNDYSDTDNGELIRFMIIKSNYKLALNSITSKQIERLTEVQSFYTDFVERYPGSKYADEAKSLNEAAKAKLKKLNI